MTMQQTKYRRQVSKEKSFYLLHKFQQDSAVAFYLRYLCKKRVTLYLHYSKNSLALDLGSPEAVPYLLRPVTQGGAGLVQTQSTQFLCQVFLQVVFSRPQQPANDDVSSDLQQEPAETKNTAAEEMLELLTELKLVASFIGKLMCRHRNQEALYGPMKWK